MQQQITNLIHSQLTDWDLAATNYAALDNVLTRTICFDGYRMLLQYNPSRIRSSAAPVDVQSVRARQCFLCTDHLPAQQRQLSYPPCYHIMLNPFPIFPQHLTVPDSHHTDQLIGKRIPDLLSLTRDLTGFFLFYNGPRCGASAPDHFHFQAGNKGSLPLETELTTFKRKTLWYEDASGTIHSMENYLRKAILISSCNRQWMEQQTTQLLSFLHTLQAQETEAMVNIISFYNEGSWHLFVFPRQKHRPAQFYETGEKQILFSPGAVDFGGLLVLPREEDFHKVTADDVADMFSQLTLSDGDWLHVQQYYAAAVAAQAPTISVGILSAHTVRFRLNGAFKLASTAETIDGEGEICAETTGNTLSLTCNHRNIIANQPLVLEPATGDTCDFELFDVVIGINFHWERKENQRFKGKLKFLIADGLLVAINILPLEDYLLSVISSEMSATSSPEFLKAHAVISRSWLLAQQEKGHKLKDSGSYQTLIKNNDGYLRWYDREEHALYDVCADDHCQRYQGITKISATHAREALKSTTGQVLMYNNTICDARFSKCCGGITETFQNVWEPVVHPYLSNVVDDNTSPPTSMPDLTDEKQAEAWIAGTPSACCNTSNKQILRQVLNDYDRETSDFFRWQTTLTQAEIKDLLLRKIGIDAGDVVDLVPVERGRSGRLIRLKIVGTKQTITIGKELEIRKALSESHLYSSAFIVEKVFAGNHLPEQFILKGAGWGHGVGLCQIGAAVMGAKGYSYREILEHYFPGAVIGKIY